MSYTTVKKVHISDLHFDHVLWKNELSFYKEELVIFQKRLDEVSGKNTSAEMKPEQSRLQNQLLIQKNEIDEISHILNVHEDSIASHSKEHPVASDHSLHTDHAGLRERVKQFIVLYTPFKQELMKFLSTWM